MRYVAILVPDRGLSINQTGKYFEVRYFLNVIVGSAHTLVVCTLTNRLALKLNRKLVTVQLPIVLIHMVNKLVSLKPVLM